MPTWAPPEAPPATAQGALPPELLGELIRLTRLGHLKGLRDALDDTLRHHPACEAEVTQLGLLLARFDLDALLDRLNASLQQAPGVSA